MAHQGAAFVHVAYEENWPVTSVQRGRPRRLYSDFKDRKDHRATVNASCSRALSQSPPWPTVWHLNISQPYLCIARPLRNRHSSWSFGLRTSHRHKYPPLQHGALKLRTRVRLRSRTGTLIDPVQRTHRSLQQFSISPHKRPETSGERDSQVQRGIPLVDLRTLPHCCAQAFVQGAQR